ncbi:MAG TPA: phosphoribosylformylglycinamidine synthase subunit PurS, partial [Pirellulaceae bacterium]|nr:phosphoribosylformylglycinamidine synthase subunit PurS [Pirellulaceae bacterium]
MANITETDTETVDSNVDRFGLSAVWQVELWAADGFPDRLALAAKEAIQDLNLGLTPTIMAAKGFLVEGPFEESEVRSMAQEYLAEPIVHRVRSGRCGDDEFASPVSTESCVVFVLPKPGVTDPEGETALELLQQSGFAANAVRTFRRYEISGVPDSALPLICQKVLCNDAIEQLHLNTLSIEQLQIGQPYQFRLRHVPLLEANADCLMEISREMQLSLTIEEMQAIQAHFSRLGREPTDIELETLAQTWSEHCSHKTLAGRIDYADDESTRSFVNMLRETIFAATEKIRAQWGADDWCVSVFKDNAGIVRFDDDYHVTFKVETHNRPSALEPYGGANTGLGGVIRDTLGTGLGAKPFCSTDVFCFAPPQLRYDELPPGVLHPRRIMKGVVAGVRDYGNRMGIPTVNGAVVFDARYAGNPLVFCGSVGLIPCHRVAKQPQPDDWIVVIGGRTGRDGIHGATFSSAELTEESERVSGGAVQIGNAITEKMLMDVLLQARDRGLYHAVTDCGAGGFSSAVGEMGAELGAEVWLERAPLKYQGLSYTEIWISEAQERMVLAVPPDQWAEFESLCRQESVEATRIGKFVPSGKLTLSYDENAVGELDMAFLHDGRPHTVRAARYRPIPEREVDNAQTSSVPLGEVLLKILASPTVASKHWIVRQYDHEVLGGSVVKPLVGACNDGPSDAAVVRPVLDSNRGVVVACGINPLF